MPAALVRLGTLVLLLQTGVAHAQTGSPPDPECATLLPAAEVEKLAGAKPLAIVGRFQVPNAGGSCNYVKEGKNLVLLVTLERGAGPGALDRYKDQAKYVGGAKPLPGVGDEAFRAKGMAGFRKGRTIVSLGTFFDPRTGKAFVTDDQLAAIAKAIATKL